MAEAKLLIVEDETIVRLHLGKIVERLGYRVAGTAASALEAYEAADLERPDLVLMDVRIEGEVDGIDAARELKRRHGCPIVFLTAYADAKTLERARQVEPAGYLVKPFEEHDVRATLAMALAKEQALARLEANSRWLRTVLGSLGDGVVVSAPDGSVQLLNPTAERLTGWSFNEAAGRQVLEILQLRSPGREEGRLEPGPLVDALLHPRRGQPREVEGVAAHLSGDDGADSGLVVVFRDVSERRQAAREQVRLLAELEASRNDLLTILNELDVGAAMLDAAGAVTFLSDAGARLLGVDPRPTLGQAWSSALPFDREAVAVIKEMMRRNPEDRSRVAARVTTGEGPRQLEIDVGDDPRKPEHRLLFVYDTTEVDDLRRLLKDKAQLHDLVGGSVPMQRAYDEIRQCAGVAWPVLIEGETGTGKELVARAVHASSERRAGPFVAVNCAGLAESLLTSQLFGHKRGAFTGAINDHRGYFEMAHGGTLFLDEIGDVSMAVQTSLLRVLEEKRVTPLGSAQSRAVDVRILTATHRDLAREVEAGRFRADLLYRIRVARVRLPPLRERGEDVALLAAWFLDRCRGMTGKDVDRIGREALERLASYAWPGNVRELRSAIEHAVIRCRGSVIRLEDLPPEIVPPTEGPVAADEKQRFFAALERAGGNRSRAAKLLGISRATFYRRLDELEISRR